jgi:hypothetical protein
MKLLEKAWVSWRNDHFLSFWSAPEADNPFFSWHLNYNSTCIYDGMIKNSIPKCCRSLPRLVFPCKLSQWKKYLNVNTENQDLILCVIQIRVSFSNFVMQPRWVSSRKWFSQIWSHVLIWKEEKIKIFLCFWLSTGTNHKNLAIGREIWRIRAIFFMENPSYRSKSYFSGRELAKIRQ